MAPIRRQTRMRNDWNVSGSLWSVAELWEWGWAVVLGLCVVSLCIMSMAKSRSQNKKTVSAQKKKATLNSAKGGVTKNKTTKSKAQSPRATKNSELSKASSSSNAKGKRKVGDEQDQPLPAKQQVKAWEESIDARDVLCERWVDKASISKPNRAIEILEEKGLTYFFKPIAGYNLNMVKEFYKNLALEDEGNLILKALVKGVEVIVSPDTVAEHLCYQRPPCSDVSSPYHEFTHKSIFDFAQIVCTDPGNFNGVFAQGKLKPDYRLMNKIIHCNISPKGSEKKPSLSEIQFLYQVMEGAEIDFARIIWTVMREFFSKTSKKNNMPFGHMVTEICKRQGVQSSEDDVFIPCMQKAIGSGTESQSAAMSRSLITPLPATEDPSTTPIHPITVRSLVSRLENKIEGWFQKLWESQEKLQSRQVQLEKKVEECITLQKRNSGMELHDSAADTSSGSSGRVREDSA